MTDLLSEHLPRMYRLAWMLTGNEADAQDLAQDAMVQALSSWSRFRGESKVTTWLTSILVNRYRTWRRSREVRSRRTPEIAASPRSEPADPSQELLQAEERKAVRDALNRLSEEERLLVALSVYQDLDSTAIGRILNRPAGTIRYRLHEAREKVRTFLTEKR